MSEAFVTGLLLVQLLREPYLLARPFRALIKLLESASRRLLRLFTVPILAFGVSVRLIPRDEQFYDLFTQLAERLTRAAQLLHQLFQEPQRRANMSPTSNPPSMKRMA